MQESDRAYWKELLRAANEAVEAIDRAIRANNGQFPASARRALHHKAESVASIASARKALGFPPLPI